MAVLGFGNEGQIYYRDESGEIVWLPGKAPEVIGEPDVELAGKLYGAMIKPKF